MKEDNLKKYINQKERIGGFIYVTLLFCVGMGLCAWLLLSKGDNAGVFKQKDRVVEKMDRQKDFRKMQEKYVPICDSLTIRIEKLDPGINAVYEENDLKFIINDLKLQYEKNPWDKSNKAFYHIGELYEIWLADKKQLWSKKQNIRYFKQNIEECQLGIERRRNRL